MLFQTQIIFFCDTKIYKISTKVDIFRLISQNHEKKKINSGLEQQECE